MPTPDDNSPLRNVEFTAVRVEDATRQLDLARAARDEAVSAALAAGHGPTEIARAANLTRRAVYDIKQRT